MAWFKKPTAAERLASAFVQEVRTSSGQERRLAAQHPQAWEAGATKAAAVCAGKKLSDMEPFQLRYVADMNLTLPPGTTEAEAFIVSFVRKAEQMIRTGEAL